MEDLGVQAGALGRRRAATAQADRRRKMNLRLRRIHGPARCYRRMVWTTPKPQGTWRQSRRGPCAEHVAATVRVSRNAPKEWVAPLQPWPWTSLWLRPPILLPARCTLQRAGPRTRRRGAPGVVVAPSPAAHGGSRGDLGRPWVRSRSGRPLLNVGVRHPASPEYGATRFHAAPAPAPRCASNAIRNQGDEDAIDPHPRLKLNTEISRGQNNGSAAEHAKSKYSARYDGTLG